jgi:hypothetical protein
MLGQKKKIFGLIQYVSAKRLSTSDVGTYLSDAFYIYYGLKQGE